MPTGPFSHIIGHAAACQALERAIASDRLAHAYLIVGPSAVGKRTLARALIASRLSGPLDAHPDFLSVTRETDEKTEKLKTAISVEQIRDVVERFSMSAIAGGHKALLIEEADRLNAAAANSLLKTLEEPRGDALIMLCAESVEAVPATIASRCQWIRLHPVQAGTIATALGKRGLSPGDAARLAGLATGLPGLALALLSDGQARAERETAEAALQSLKHASIARRFRVAGEMLPKEEANKVRTLENTFDIWERVLHAELLQSAARSGDAKRTAVSLRALAESRHAIRHNVNPQLALERVILTL